MELINNREWDIYPSFDLRKLDNLFNQIQDLMNFDLENNPSKINEYKVNIYSDENKIINTDLGVNCLKTLSMIFFIKRQMPKEEEEEIFDELDRIKNKKRKYE